MNEQTSRLTMMSESMKRMVRDVIEVSSETTTMVWKSMWRSTLYPGWNGAGMTTLGECFSV